MTLQRTPSILIFDVNETLLDLTSLEPLFARVFGEGRVMREWFAQLVLYSQTLTLSGSYATFSDLASGVLRMVGTTSRVAVTDDDVAELKKMIGSMPAHADAAPALARLRDAGFRLVTLTNSPPSPAPTPLERAGLAHYFEAAYSVDTVKKFKPAVETYRLVADELGVGLEDTCLVACHLWDTVGAQQAGGMGALVLRPGNALLPTKGVAVPDLTVNDLGELAEQLIAQQASTGH